MWADGARGTQRRRPPTVDAMEHSLEIVAFAGILRVEKLDKTHDKCLVYVPSRGAAVNERALRLGREEQGKALQAGAAWQHTFCKLWH